LSSVVNHVDVDPVWRPIRAASIDDRADLSLAASEYSKVLRARGSIDEAFAMLELAQTRR